MRGIKQFSLDFSILVKANRHYKEKTQWLKVVVISLEKETKILCKNSKFEFLFGNLLEQPKVIGRQEISHSFCYLKTLSQNLNFQIKKV